MLQKSIQYLPLNKTSYAVGKIYFNLTTCTFIRNSRRHTSKPEKIMI